MSDDDDGWNMQLNSSKYFKVRIIAQHHSRLTFSIDDHDTSPMDNEDGLSYFRRPRYPATPYRCQCASTSRKYTFFLLSFLVFISFYPSFAR